jgi:hypothetical protein
MKKVLSILFVSALMVSLTACSGDDDSSSNNNGGNNNDTDQIVGTWKLYGDMVEGEIIPGNIEACDDEIYKFQSNGDLKITEKFCGESSDVYNINWEKSGDLYKMVAEGQVIEAFYVVFSEDGNYAIHYESVDEMNTQFYGEVFKKS